MHRKTTFIIAAATSLAAAAAPALAQPQTKAKRHPQPIALAYNGERPPLTVNKRSFLDPGPVVPVGSMSNYVTASTIFNRTPDQVAHRSLYGNESLPWPLEVPGRPSPIVEFETPAVD
jgi:hypothetical protein